jgi:riboflavin transporter FmnP
MIIHTTKPVVLCDWFNTIMAIVYVTLFWISNPLSALVTGILAILHLTTAVMFLICMMSDKENTMRQYCVSFSIGAMAGITSTYMQMLNLHSVL